MESGSDAITQEHYGDRGLFQSPSFVRTEDTRIEGWGLGNLTLQQQNSSEHVVVMSPVPGPELRPMPAIPKRRLSSEHFEMWGCQRFGVAITIGISTLAGRPLPVVRNLEHFLAKKMKHEACCHFFMR